MVNSGVFPVPSRRGGTENHVYQLTRSLIRQKVLVDLVSELSGDADRESLGKVIPVGIREAGIFNRGFWGYGLRNLVGGLAASLRALGTPWQGYDLVHSHGRIVPFCLTIASKIPVVCTVHDDPAPLPLSHHLSYRLNDRFIWRGFVKRSDHVIALHNGNKERLLRLGIPEERISVVPNGVDTEVFRPINDEKGSYCLYVGSLVERKGVSILLKSLAEIGSLKCHIVGTGPESYRLRKEAQDLAIEQRVAFLGNIPIHDLVREYQRAQFLVLPSYSEGMPLSVLEAMSSGTPVLTTDTPGLRELVLENETGILLKPGKPTDLARGLLRMAENPRRTRAMGLRARRLVEGTFAWKRIAREIAKVYRKVLGG